MSRKDTIIIAVLINTGMLAILFMMAIHTEDEVVQSSYDISQTIVQEQLSDRKESREAHVSVALAKTPARDEVDIAIDDYVKNQKTPSLPAAPSISSFAPTALASPKEKPRSEAEKQYVEITVKRGDCLGKIALANNTTIKEIKEANGFTDERIDTGQVIRVPINTRKKTLAHDDEQPAKPARVGEEFYTMRKGDNPWKIAKQFHVKFEDLLILNNLDEEKAKNLKIGDRIRVK